MLGAARRLARRAWLFVRHDLPELAAPSSLPTPPAAAAAADARKRRPRLTLADHREVWRTAWAAYRASFDDLLPRRRGEHGGDTAAQGGAASGGEGAELKAEAAAAARAGAERARPVLRELYQTRAGAYRDGVREFVLGYREAFRDALLQEAARVQQEAAHARAHPQEAARPGGEAASQAEGAPRQAVPPEAQQQPQGAESPRTPRSD